MADRRFEISVVDQKRLIKENDLQKITNSAMFNSNNGPTPDGLLSNEIFGITKEERSGIFAYIDLNETFIEPYYYKIWLKIDRNLRSCIYGTEYFKIDKDGYLVKDEDGNTGLKWLIKNIDKINFKNTKKDQFLTVLQKAKKEGTMFMNQFIITPPFYRDVNTQDGRMGVGEINKLYVHLMNNCRAIQESNDYGLDMADSVRGRIQDLTLEIYNWYTMGETESGGEHTGAGIFKKFGAMRRSVMAKTTDYSVRLVISAQDLNVNRREDLMVDLDYCAMPLPAALVILYPFVIFELRQFLMNEFGGKITYPVIDENGKAINVELDDPLIAFSDDRLDKELNEFIHGYSNRLKPIDVPTKDGKKYAMHYLGYKITKEQYAAGIRETAERIERQLTWVDVFYYATCRAAEDKTAIIARYPINYLWHYTGNGVVKTALNAGSC